MLTTKRFNRLHLGALALALILGGLLMTQTSLAQESREDYDVSIHTPNSMSQKRGAEIVVRVRTPQGSTAQGVPVRFDLDPVWQGDATIVPQQTTTDDHGIARTRLRADLIGYVKMTVRVGHGTVIKQTGLAVFPIGDGEPS